MEISSQPLVWKPTSAEKSKKLQGSVEVTALKLSAGGGAAHVSIYDSADLNGCNDNSLRWVLDASTTDNDFNPFEGPIGFSKGVFAICDQGWDFNPEVMVACRKYPGG